MTPATYHPPFTVTTRGRLRRLAGVLIALTILAAATSPARDSEPDISKQKLYMSYGDYMTSAIHAMVPLILEAQADRHPGFVHLRLGVGAHGDVVKIWESGAVSWMHGKGKVKETNWRDNKGGKRVAEKVEGRKPDLVVVQLGLKVDRKRKSIRHGDKVEEAVAGYVQAAKEAQTPLVFCVLPGAQHTTHKKDRKTKQQVKKTAEDYEAELKVLNAEVLRLSRKYQAVLAPVPQAYANLRKLRPDLDIHAPVRGDDHHASPLDSYLFACAVAFSTMDEMPDKVPASEVLFKQINEKIARKNKKRREKGQKEDPLVSLSKEQQEAIHQAVWAAVEELRKATGRK